MSAARYDWFSAFGIEIEYAIVDADSLAVRLIADRVLREGDRVVGELDQGELAWSNELVAHVIELKANGPAPRLEPLVRCFERDLAKIDALLERHNARLMPSAMHPLMDPARETELWPHAQHEIYAAFDRAFDCKRHGWANLQSMHVNLPFDSDEQFGRLHAAIRVVLPLIPALAASSPFVEGKVSGKYDTRLDFYRTNSARVPSITGHVVPEAVFDESSYRSRILEPIARDIAAFDPDRIFEADWVNARGAIARFDRGSIEIRVIDTQECPSADLAIARLIIAVVQALAEERWSSYGAQQRWSDVDLAAILLDTTDRGSDAVIDVPGYLELFGLEARAYGALEVWRRLADRLSSDGCFDATAWQTPLEALFRGGCLASRLLRAVGPEPSRDALAAVYFDLCACLRQDRPFTP